MSALIVLIIISISVALGFLIAFFWAVKNGQYDDEYTPSIRMLWDSKDHKKESENKHSSPKQEKE